MVQYSTVRKSTLGALLSSGLAGYFPLSYRDGQTVEIPVKWLSSPHIQCLGVP